MSHICLFYSDLDYQTRAVTNFFSKAIGQGRKCIYVAKNPDLTSSQLNLPEIDFYPLDDVYLINGRFNRDKAISFWKLQHDKFKKQGLTITGEASFLKSDFINLVEYEQFMDYKLETEFLDIEALCQYYVDSPRKLQLIKNAHPIIWGDRLSFLQLTTGNLLNAETSILKCNCLSVIRSLKLKLINIEARLPLLH